MWQIERRRVFKRETRGLLLFLARSLCIAPPSLHLHLSKQIRPAASLFPEFPLSGVAQSSDFLLLGFRSTRAGSSYVVVAPILRTLFEISQQPFSKKKTCFAKVHHPSSLPPFLLLCHLPPPPAFPQGAEPDALSSSCQNKDRLCSKTCGMDKDVFFKKNEGIKERKL